VLIRRVVPVALSLALLAGACSEGGDDGTSPSEARPTGSAETEPADTAAIEAQIAELVDAYVEVEGLNGASLVVVDADDVVHEYSTGELDLDRVSLIASASKQLTAGVLLHLEDEGLIDLDAPVAESVEWGDAHPQITVAQLLSNSSGLPGLLDDPTFPPYLCQYLAAGSLQACAEQIFTTPDDDDFVEAPDTRFRYGGGQWQVAGAVAEIVSGRSWAELIEEVYVEPCGLDVLGYNNHYTQLVSDDGPFRHPDAFDGDPDTLAPTDNPNMEGGAYITPRDYGRLLQMHLSDGRCGDDQVISTDALDRMRSDRVGPLYGGTDLRGDAEVTRRLGGYGLGWWVDTDNPAYVEDGGAFGAVPWLDMDRGYGAYLALEATSRNGRELAGQIRPLVEELVDVRAD